jgi:hypothetical protein
MPVIHADDDVTVADAAIPSEDAATAPVEDGATAPLDASPAPLEASPAPSPASPADVPVSPAPNPPNLDFTPLVNPAAVSSPAYGMSMFLWGHPDSTKRDLLLATDAGFGWQKTLFQWREIEKDCKGCFNWAESDRVVKASTQAGVKVIARLDFQPTWSRKDGAHNGPPDNYQDFADYVSALVGRYKTGSAYGQVQAIEVWNEPNIDREWGMGAINPQQAADYVRLLGGAYRAAKAADPNVTVVTAGLSPTGVTNGQAADDVTYMQWLFSAGLKGGVNYDALGAHGNTQAPCVSCDLNSLPAFGHPSFYFRRIEQIRAVQVRNGDANRQVWLLEFGWTSDQIHQAYSWFAVSEDQKAKNVVEAFRYAKANWSPWIGVMTLWTLTDPSWPKEREEYWWAISNADGSPRQAYTAVKAAQLAGQLG